jgi:hypothetical protein
MPASPQFLNVLWYAVIDLFLSGVTTRFMNQVSMLLKWERYALFVKDRNAKPIEIVSIFTTGPTDATLDNPRFWLWF